MDIPAVNVAGYFICILICFLMYGFCEAVTHIPDTEVEKRISKKSKSAAIVKKFCDDPRKLISTVHEITFLIAVFISKYQLESFSLKLDAFFSEKFGRYLAEGVTTVLSYALTALYITFVLTALGILIPKILAAKHPVGWAIYLAKVVNLLVIVFMPYTVLVNFLAGLVLRIFGVDPNAKYENVTEEEIVSMVNEGHEKGVLLASEAEMINNIIELDEKVAADIMIHRKNIVAIDNELTLKEAVEFMLNESFSRFPVYNDNIDDVVGILHIRDAVEKYHNEELKDVKIKDIPNLYLKCDYIPETRSVDDLFKEMQKNKMHMVVVIDEYGQTSGIVAMEDILEEIVGNILDEHDKEQVNLIDEGNGVYVARGEIDLEELEDLTGITFDEEDYDTLNGLLISKLDRIPDDNDKLTIEINGNTYQILSVKNKMIESVKITVNESEENEEIDNMED